MKRFFNPKAEVLRIRFLYRKLILDGKVKLPPEHAAKLVGPDCAYHLYRVKSGPQSSSRDEEGEGISMVAQKMHLERVFNF